VVPVACYNFLYGFKGARLRLPPGAGGTRARDGVLKTRSAGGRMRGGEHDHKGRGRSGEWAGICPRPGLSPLPAGRWLLAVTRSPAPRLADRCGWPVQRCRRLFAVKVRRLGRSRWSRLAMAHKPRHPRLRPPTANPLAPIRLDGADSRPGAVSRLGSSQLRCSSWSCALAGPCRGQARGEARSARGRKARSFLV
jgi:hypothetical protein